MDSLHQLPALTQAAGAEFPLPAESVKMDVRFGKVQSRRIRGSLLARFPSLATAYLCLRKQGLTKDCACYIIWHSNLASIFFHLETETLRLERFEIQFAYWPPWMQMDLNECILFATRHLRWEPGVLRIYRSKKRAGSFNFHQDRCEHLCAHYGQWLRVKPPSPVRDYWVDYQEPFLGESFDNSDQELEPPMPELEEPDQ